MFSLPLVVICPHCHYIWIKGINKQIPWIMRNNKVLACIRCVEINGEYVFDLKHGYTCKYFRKHLIANDDSI